jgi:hypothetical protein
MCVVVERPTHTTGTPQRHRRSHHAGVHRNIAAATTAANALFYDWTYDDIVTWADRAYPSSRRV